MQSQEPRLCVYQLSLWYLLELVTLKCVRDTVLATIISFNTTYTYTYVHIYVCIHMHICMQYVAVPCSVMHYIAFCWSVLQCVAVSQFWPGVLFYFIKTESMEDSIIHYARSVGPWGPQCCLVFYDRGKADRDRKQVWSHWESSQNSSCNHVASPCSSPPPFVDNHRQSRWLPTSSTRSDSFKQRQK